MGEKGIPFTIENMDVMDTPEVRDLLACLGAIDSTATPPAFSALLRFPNSISIPKKFAPPCAPFRVSRSRVSRSRSPVCCKRSKGSGAVLSTLQKTRDQIQRGDMKSLSALQSSCGILDLTLRFLRLLRALLKFVEAWERKPLTRTGEIGELLEYLDIFPGGTRCGLPCNRRMKMRFD